MLELCVSALWLYLQCLLNQLVNMVTALLTPCRISTVFRQFSCKPESQLQSSNIYPPGFGSAAGKLIFNFRAGSNSYIENIGKWVETCFFL